MTKQGLYFDDLHVGDTFTSERHRVTAEDIKRFAREFDPQPFHVDDETARPTLFGGLAASGWHTAAITMRLLIASVPLADGIVGISIKLDWKTPTRPEDLLRVTSEVVELTPSRSRPDRGTAVVRTTTLNERGDAVQAAMATLLVSRRSSTSNGVLQK